MSEKTLTKVNVEAAQEEVPEEDVSQVAASTLDKWWIVELGALTLSLAALFGIFAMLWIHQDKPAPTTLVTKQVKGYGVRFTLNSYISICSTVFKTSLAVPIAAAISQLKWTWFRRSRPLADYVLIEKSKGLVGSLMLLWKFRARSVYF